MKKNPLEGITKEWFQGINAMDAGAALGGLAASTWLPGMLVKTQATTVDKVIKLGVSALGAAGAGFVFRNVSTSAGKMAVAGGMAGLLSQAIGMFTNVQIGQSRYRKLPAGDRQSIRESRFTPMYSEESGVQVSVT